MAELVDALVSGTSVRMDVQVRVLFWAQIKNKNRYLSMIYDGFYFSTYIIAYNNYYFLISLFTKNTNG